jgi:hypothetical protein
MNSITPAPWIVARRQRMWTALAMFAAVAAPAIATPALAASLVIDPTFASTITSDPDAAAIEGAIDAAITTLEADITTPITVAIDFQEMSGGLGQSETSEYNVSYFNYYDALKAIDTGAGSTAAQQSAIASLGTAPTGVGSGNPVNGNTEITATSADLRALGFDATGGVNGSFDSLISLNTSITSPPNSLNGGTYDLEATAQHEIDETLGIGGTGSTLGGSPTGPVGPLDLFRYSAPGVRSYSTVQTTSPFSYMSIDGGTSVISYFNQTAGADYADWLSNPIPNGYSPQVQDAFGAPGASVFLGPNELTALNVIGYTLTTSNPVPEPMSLAIMLPGVLGLIGLRRRTRKAKAA